MSSPNNNREIQECPYKGLVPYEEEDAAFFFGREKWSGIITDNLLSSRLTIVYGTSGVGKTSVLRAGVAHHLRELAQKNLGEFGQPEFAVVVFNAWRDDDPLQGLLQKVEKDVKKILPEVSVPEGGTSLAKTLEDWAKVLVNAPEESGKLFIILDQFEEYFLYHPNGDGKGTFADEFPRAINQSGLPVNFLISIREDALAQLDRFKGRIPNLFGNYLRIPYLDEESAVDAIRQPLRVFNQRLQPGAKSIGIETELVQEVLEQVKAGQFSIVESGQGGIDRQLTESQEEIETPFLQLVMFRLWAEEMKVGSDRLRLETFKKLGGADNIVKQHLNERMEPLSREEKDIAAKVFQYLVTPGGTKIAYPALELAETAGVAEKKLKLLLKKLSSSEQRILRPVGSSPEKPNVERYEIFHDKLAPAILAWRKEYQHKQDVKRSQLVTAVVSCLGIIFLGLFIRSEYQRSLAAVSEIRSIIASSMSRSISQEYFDSLIDDLRAFKKLKDIENSWTLGWFSSSKTKEDLGLDIQKLLQRDLNRVNEKNRLAGHQGEVVDVSFSRDGQTIATASEDGTVKLWKLNGEAISSPLSLPSEDSFCKTVRSVSFSPDGQTLATGRQDGTVQIWTAEGKEIAKLQRSEDLKCDETKDVKVIVWKVQFSPDGQTLASAYSNGKVRIWHYQGKKTSLLQEYQAHEVIPPDPANPQKKLPIVSSVSFSPDGKTLATTSDNNTVKLWDLKGKNQPIATLKGHTEEIWDISFSPNGQILATASKDGTAKLWNLDGKERTNLTGHNGVVTSVNFTTYGKETIIATTSDDTTVKLWNLAGKELQTLEGHDKGVWKGSFSPDGRVLATASRDKTLRLWNLNSQNLFGHARRGQRGTKRDIYQVRFSPDGQTLASASADGSVKLWGFDERDSNGLRYIKTIQSPDRKKQPIEAKKTGFTAVSFSPNGRTIAAVGDNGTAKIWNLEGDRSSNPISLEGHNQNKTVWGVNFSPKGNILATASEDGTAKLWTFNGNNGKLLRNLIDYKGTIRSLDFSRNGEILAAVSGDSEVWVINNPETQQEVQPLFPIGSPIFSHFRTSIRLSPSGDLLAVASLDGTVGLWSLNGQERTPMDGNISKIRHDNSKIRSVDFAPNGQLLVTASDDGTLKLWNLQGKLLNTFVGHGRGALTQNEGVLSARFSPKGTLIASSGRDGRIILWKPDLKLEDIVKKSCDWVRDYLENNPTVKEEDKARDERDRYQSLCQQIDQDIKSQK